MVRYNGTPPGNQSPRLLEQVRVAIRAKHYSLRTEDTYVQWIRRFILFHDKRHPQAMGAAEVQRFLTDLAVTRQVAAATQNQALSALVFLYKEVLHHDFGWLDDVVRAKKPAKLPVVLTRDEVKRVFQHLSGTSWLMASLLYGAGLRLMECLRLRIKDVDFATHQLMVREGKGRTIGSRCCPTASTTGWHSISARCNSSIRAISRQGLGVSICRMPWSGNTRRPRTIGSGNTSFQRPEARSTPAVVSNGGIMWRRWR